MTIPVTWASNSWPWNYALLCFPASKRENLHNCVTKKPSWVPSLPCVFSALETWNLLPPGRWQSWLWGSKGTRWVMCVKKNKYTHPVTVRLDSECDQRLRMFMSFRSWVCERKWPVSRKRALRFFIMCKMIRTMILLPLFAELCNRSAHMLHSLSEIPWNTV